MHAEETFDSFYASTRRHLLHQAFALTGDLAAAQAAVRDAYVAAWHHWRKVAPLVDRVAWVRQLAWRHAQRRHAGRIWHRTKGLAPENVAVLEGLSKLSTTQRRVLILVQLAGVPLPLAARELGITEHLAEQQLQVATAALATRLATDSTALRVRLLALDEALDAVRLPRGSVIRRAGRKRRQVHTAAAVLAAVALVVGSGVAVYEPEGARAASVAAGTTQHGDDAQEPADAEETADAQDGAELEGAEQALEPDLPTADDLLDQDQISRLGMELPWQVASTHDNTRGSGINTVCQQSRFADPAGITAIVRTFTTPGRRRSAIQTVEVSASVAQARETFRTTLGWYAGCRVARLQLLEAYRVDNIGDSAAVLMMRVWDRPVTTYSVAVARTGDVTTTTVSRAVGLRPPPPQQITQSLADSVSMLCGRSRSATCAKTPEFQVVPPPPSGEEEGLLAVADLPPVGRIEKPWVGTRARPARPNPSMTTCDRANFAAQGARRTRARVFLIPQARLPAQFGLSESYGVFADVKQAQRFLAGVRKQVRGCEDRNLAATVTDAGSGRRGASRWSIWRVTTEVSERAAVRFRVGFVRVGATVAQITFAPGPRADMTDAQFHSLLLRAGDRLLELHRPRTGPTPGTP